MIQQEPVYFTLEPEDNRWVLFKHSTYEHWSVLAGQERRERMAPYGGYASIQEAQADNLHMQFEVKQGSTRVEHLESDTPPYWFDPLAAGERW